MSVLSERIKQYQFGNAGHEAILNIMLTSSHIRERLNSICLEHSISLQQFNILRILKGIHPEGFPRCEISERMVERAPDTTRLIDRLVKSGYVRREKSSADMRQSIAKITKNGINLLAAINERIDQFTDNFESQMGTANCKHISEFCDNILKKT
ncbi:MAG: MarR family transcriptional regulator [Calditrichaeota bacterium]|nr:MarR family transcriptional regulator [Calditrichota bacterium]